MTCVRCKVSTIMHLFMYNHNSTNIIMLTYESVSIYQLVVVIVFIYIYTITTTNLYITKLIY